MSSKFSLTVEIDAVLLGRLSAVMHMMMDGSGADSLNSNDLVSGIEWLLVQVSDYAFTEQFDESEVEKIIAILEKFADSIKQEQIGRLPTND